MILILASRRDAAARDLAARWSHVDAAVVTCRDVCRPGWQADERGAQTLCVDGRVIDAAEVEGVLGRVAYLMPDELSHLDPGDRPYAAAELSAFLVAWLAALDVPMLNRPTATCLSGPGWQPEQWMHAAASIGLDVLPMRRRVPDDRPPEDVDTVTVTVVADTCVGARDDAMAAAALALARRAGTALVELAFAAGTPAPTFVRMGMWPDVLRSDLGELALAALTAGRAHPLL